MTGSPDHRVISSSFHHLLILENMKVHLSKAKDPCHICVLEFLLGFYISLVTGIQIVYLYYVDSYFKVMVLHIRGKSRFMYKRETQTLKNAHLERWRDGYYLCEFHFFGLLTFYQIFWIYPLQEDKSNDNSGSSTRTNVKQACLWSFVKEMIRLNGIWGWDSSS